MRTTRRELLGLGAGLGAALTFPRAALTRPRSAPARRAGDPLFRISLAQWSLHRRLRAGELAPLDFPAFARGEFGVEAVEYVNQFFPDKAGDFRWLEDLRARCEQAGVRSLLIMIDAEGDLAEPDDAARREAVENHFRWIAAAAFLGCHSLRVNASGSGSWEDQAARMTDSLRRLGDFADPYGIDVIVENHGGPSASGKWLSDVVRRAAHPRVGTLPDFGNFRIAAGEEYDRYQGTRELMPWARGVSAKSYAFDERGEETTIDYHRMLRLVVEAGYRGHVGIEYEGEAHSELDGVRLTQRLLERVCEELAAEAR
jgi:L-ribulose-5-phosphate 3-epimerase